MSIFKNKNFYPTPESAGKFLLQNLDLFDKVVLEPHGGNGQLIDQIRQHFPKEILTCELDEELSAISKEKADRFIKPNFLDVVSDEISHVDYIIANPPFDKAAEHILHMWGICPEGCTIVSFINYETYNKFERGVRFEFKRTVDKFGSVKNLGNLFSNADRKTDVEIGLVTLHKEKTGDNEFEDYLFSNEEEEEVYGGSGVMSYSKIRDIVGRYIQGVKMFDSIMDTADEINNVISPLGGEFNVKFSAIEYRGDNYSQITRDVYKKQLQKSAWKSVFKEMKMDKYLTQSARDKVNKFVEMSTDKPFTMKNVYAMIEMIFGTHQDRMLEVIEDRFDWLTKHHKENREGVEGWKTNSMYFVGKKFIAPYCGLRMGYSGEPSIEYGRHSNEMDDLTKALCVISGKNYDDMVSLRDFFEAKEIENEDAVNFYTKASEETGVRLDVCNWIHGQLKSISETNKEAWIRRKCIDINWIKEEELTKLVDYYLENKPSPNCFGKRYDRKEWGKWYEWNFFKIKVYKKGTMHCQFLDDKVWEDFNKIAVKKKGWQLPTKTGSDARRKTDGVEIYQN